MPCLYELRAGLNLYIGVGIVLKEGISEI